MEEILTESQESLEESRAYIAMLQAQQREEKKARARSVLITGHPSLIIICHFSLFIQYQHLLLTLASLSPSSPLTFCVESFINLYLALLFSCVCNPESAYEEAQSFRIGRAQ